jgi:deoxyhypusine synthase
MKNYLEIEEWIKKVINSCKTQEQIITANKLINIFGDQLKNKNIVEYWREHQHSIIIPLEVYLNNKKKEIL